MRIELDALELPHLPREARIRYLQTEGYIVGRAFCCRCHHNWDAALPSRDIISYKLNCPACGWENPSITGSNNHFTEYPLTGR